MSIIETVGSRCLISTQMHESFMPTVMYVRIGSLHV